MEVDKLEEGEQIFTENLRKGILPPKRVKGRGPTDSMDKDQRYSGDQGLFESLNQEESLIKPGEPIKSIEGWIVVVSNIHEEAQESDLRDLFCEYGAIRNMHLNYDRRTGFTKGYALIEYEHQKEAEAAIAESGKLNLAGQNLTVDFAFVASSETSSSSHTIQLKSVRGSGSGRRSLGDRSDRDRDGNSNFSKGGYRSQRGGGDRRNRDRDYNSKRY